jgi:hypothetical protein
LWVKEEIAWKLLRGNCTSEHILKELPKRCLLDFLGTQEAALPPDLDRIELAQSVIPRRSKAAPRLPRARRERPLEAARAARPLPSPLATALPAID